MATAKGKAMFSINDHPDIRNQFSRFHCHEIDIKCSNGSQAKGTPTASRDLVFTNCNPLEIGQLF